MTDKNSKPSQAVETLLKVLEKAGLDPKPLEDVTGFTITFEEDGPQVAGVTYLFEDESRFLFYLQLIKTTPPDTLPQVAEFITRANFGMSVGNFELDYENGSVRFKTSVDYQGAELLAPFVRNAILAAMDGVELYAEALIDVMGGKKTPGSAIFDVEGSY
jgi:hypothetical protein